jgi:predicted amidohydrolase YtcJ
VVGDEPGAAPDLIFAGAEIGPGRVADVLVADGLVADIGSGLRGAEVFDCRGGALLPGLHDHHCHLLATAAAGESVMCGPPDVRTRGELVTALCTAPARNGWLRGVGYDEAVAGDLDRASLDTMRSDLPVRVQHRSGALWVLNSAALAEVGGGFDGLERDAAGEPTGRLWRGDAWLRDRVGVQAVPDLATLSQRLASYGVTGVTDATVDLGDVAARLLRSGVLAQRVLLLGAPDALVPRKVVVSDHALPSFDDLASVIASARPDPVAVHSVSRASLLLTLAVLQQVGATPRDRIEHAAVAPAEAIAMIAELGLTVVTQPSLVAMRGDDYLDRVDADDRDALWPFRSFLDAGVEVGCSSDAPYGDLDPWLTIRAASERTAPSGRAVAPHEAVSAERALAGFLSSPERPGGPARRIEVGAQADLVLLDRPRAEALATPSREYVTSTVIGGRIRYRR